MKKNKIPTNIHNSVGLLHKIAPTTISELQATFPQFIKHLNKGRLGGETISSDFKELLFKGKVVKKTLEEVIKSTGTHFLPLIRKKNQRLRKLEFWSQVIILVSTTSIIGMLMRDVFGKEGNEIASYIAATLSFISALLTLILKQNLGEWSFSNRNIMNDQEQLIDLKVDAISLLNTLDAKIENAKHDENNSFEKAINEGDNLNKKMRKIIEHYPQSLKVGKK